MHWDLLYFMFYWWEQNLYVAFFTKWGDTDMMRRWRLGSDSGVEGANHVGSSPHYRWTCQFPLMVTLITGVSSYVTDGIMRRQKHKKMKYAGMRA